MRRALLFPLVALCWAGTAGGAELPRPFTAADSQFFEAKVRPVLVERCFACHSAAAKKQRGGLRLDSRAAAVQGGDTGPAVVPGRPDESLLVKAVRQQDESLQMPPKGKLPPREIAALEEWV